MLLTCNEVFPLYQHDDIRHARTRTHPVDGDMKVTDCTTVVLGIDMMSKSFNA
jgi:hypothetical protein